jgi:hypothetical protein
MMAKMERGCNSWRLDNFAGPVTLHLAEHPGVPVGGRIPGAVALALRPARSPTRFAPTSARPDLPGAALAASAAGTRRPAPRSAAIRAR